MRIPETVSKTLDNINKVRTNFNYCEMRFLLATLLSAFTSQGVLACSCLLPFDFSLYEFYANETIFMGKCVSAEVDTISTQYTNYVFEIVESYKDVQSATITIQSAHVDGMCGSKFIPGNRYLVFANDGRTSSCSGNLAFDSDSLNLWNFDSKIGVILKDTMIYLSGAELMPLLKEVNREKLEVLREIASIQTGEVRSYFCDGDLNSRVSINYGILNGGAEFYHQNRKLKFKGSFKNGMKEGFCEEYILSRKKNNSGYVYIKEWGEYKNDVRVGTWNYLVLEGHYQEALESIGKPEMGDEGFIKY